MLISYSQITKYKECQKKWELHYLKKIRSVYIPSPLHFGNALDEAFNVLLLTKKKKLLGEEKQLVKQDALAVFDHHFVQYVVDKDVGPIDISAHHFMQYSNSDFSYELLLEEDYEKLETYIKNAGFEGNPDPIDLYEEIKEEIVQGNKLELTQQCYFNYCSWLSLRQKGHLMVECYKNEILPKIKEVHSIQRKVSLPNGEGDDLIGYIDAEIEFEDHEGVHTADNKSSSSRYKEDAVNDIEEKGQLLIYDEEAENKKGAYIVVLKKPRYIKHKVCLKCEEPTTGREDTCAVEVRVPGKKEGTTKKGRCGGVLEIEELEPIIDHQIITDDIDEDKKDLLFEEISDIMYSMKVNKVHQENRDSCFSFGRKCAYFDYCRRGSMEGLKVKKGSK